MRKIKHSKYRNSGFLFELLVRQVTADILAESTKKSKAERLLKKYFHPSTEIGKERQLYEVLLEKKLNTESKAEHFITLVVQERKKLSEEKLKREKYNLIKDIKEAYSIETFFRNPISNYKTLASVYKIFESSTIHDVFDPTDVIDSKYTLIEHIMNTSPKAKKGPDPLLEYRSQDKDVRTLTNRILIERFNEKYSDLSKPQKKLLREYINNITDKRSFKQYVDSQVPLIKRDLIGLSTRIKDDVTKIKLKETLNVLNKIRSKKMTDDKAMGALMLCYELKEEIHNVTSK